MADAESITFTSDQRTGVGTTFECTTKVGPLRTTDKMTVTVGRRSADRRVPTRGIVIGTGVFELAARDAASTRMSGPRTCDFRGILGGVVTAALAHARSCGAFGWAICAGLRADSERLKSLIEICAISSNCLMMVH